MPGNTKIIATIGPASGHQKTILQMAEAGMDAARINFSHGDHKTHKENIIKIRRAEAVLKRPIGILADLGGPKIRVGSLPGGRPIDLKRGEDIIFAPEGTAKRGDIPVTFRNLADDVKAGDRLLLDDGRISVVVKKTEGRRIIAGVIDGGRLSERKGINLPETALSTSAITKKDVDDLKFALSMGVDFIGISFVQCRGDILAARRIIQKSGGATPVVAKIERQTAVQNIDEITKAADAVMVARGDLGVETRLENVPILQKRIIDLAARFKRPVIVATQMLESMIKSARPTRAEVSDVANSVFDGTDAVMLSGETAVGHNPVNAIKTMVRIIEAAEKSRYHRHGTYELDHKEDTAALATTRAACFAAEEARAKAICVFTMTGRSALYISKQRPDVHVIAMTNSDETSRRLSLYYGIRAVKMPCWNNIDKMIKSGIAILRSGGLIRRGEKIVVVCGTTTTPGATNMIKIQEL